MYILIVYTFSQLDQTQIFSPFPKTAKINHCIFPLIILCSHRWSDQLDCPDHLNSLIKPNQACLNSHLTTPIRPWMTFYDFFTMKTRPTCRLLLDHQDQYASHSWSSLTNWMSAPLLPDFHLTIDCNRVVNGHVLNCSD